MSKGLFSSTKLSKLGLERLQLIEDSFTALHEALSTLCGPGRLWAIAETKLEEASMFAKKSLVAYEENRYTEPPLPKKSGYILEFRDKEARDAWELSRNENRTLNVGYTKGRCNDHSNTVFPTKKAALLEIKAQPDRGDLEYRARKVD